MSTFFFFVGRGGGMGNSMSTFVFLFSPGISVQGNNVKQLIRRTHMKQIIQWRDSDS